MNNSVFVDLLETINCIQMTVSCRYKPDVGIPRLSSISVQSGSSKPGSRAVAGKGRLTQRMRNRPLKEARVHSRRFVSPPLPTQCGSPTDHNVRPYHKGMHSPGQIEEGLVSSHCIHSPLGNHLRFERRKELGNLRKTIKQF
ncbi:hypothetical protein F7725_017671 [Dissostichus mawsoni]|uniref:Uncharacterized protein n=1 Tax=Dissostichus mawsoni TaxID=36200 RepID=A0A7J5Z9C2_DISMA|nr:hypothetical protein F7725_017671 [Dissostichus mawsoni]